MKKHIELRQGTAEFELFIAQGELETGLKLAHGADHLANLLSYDPGNTEWLELAKQYAQKVERPIDEKLLPINEEQRYYATEALRAWFWNYEGRLNDAVSLLIQVTRAKSTPRYLDAWVLTWLEADNALESLQPDLANSLFSVVLLSFPEAKFSSYQQLQTVRRWVSLIDRLSTATPDQVPVRRMFEVGLLRKAGLFDEALAKAPPLEQAKSWHECIAIGLVLTQMKRPEEAEKAFRKALEIDPQDISALLEAADGWFLNQHWEKALAWYGKVLEADAQHPWALPSSWLCQWKLTSDEQWIDRIVDEARNPESRASQRARQLWQYLFDGLPEPQDATANVLRQLREEFSKNPPKAADEESGEIKLTLSSLEAPSNALAIDLDFATIGLKNQLSIIVQAIPEPDPRVAKEPVEWLLWRYEGTDASPALPAPDSETLAHIARLAAMPYDPAANWAAASYVAHELGPQKAAQILATMVHPPAVPAGSDALTWLPRVQYCAMQVVAQLDTGWENAVRRKALLSALFGPTDWTTQAAIRAMAWIAEQEPAYALDIHECFNRLEKHQQNTGFTCWLETLYQCWQNIPILYDREIEALEQKLQALTEEESA